MMEKKIPNNNYREPIIVENWCYSGNKYITLELPSSNKITANIVIFKVNMDGCHRYEVRI